MQSILFYNTSSNNSVRIFALFCIIATNEAITSFWIQFTNNLSGKLIQNTSAEASLMFHH